MDKNRIAVGAELHKLPGILLSCTYDLRVVYLNLQIMKGLLLQGTAALGFLGYSFDGS